jgi:zinc/manganese transport system substrate-binding protein
MQVFAHAGVDRGRMIGALVGAIVLGVAGCASAVAAPAARIPAIGVENQYADVIGQIGGAYVQVAAIETDPNTDPHAFEVSPKVARQIAAAGLIVKNGIGYDAWVDKIIAATPRADRHVIDVQHLLGLPDSTANPHLWYDPTTMPAVAQAIAAALSALVPAHAAYFAANLATFDASLAPWTTALAALRTGHAGTPVAVTEPVANEMLRDAGCVIVTPGGLQTAIMNGTDPAPQDVTLQNALFTGHKVRVFVYNQQVTDSLTQSFRDLAKKNGIAVVGVYETMPTPGYTYQSWMMAEVAALQQAITDNMSTETLQAGSR